MVIVSGSVLSRPISHRGGEYGSCVCLLLRLFSGNRSMALSRPRPVFSHRRTVRLVVDDNMEIDSLELAKSLPDFAERITGVVPQFGGKCFDITLSSAEAVAELAQSGFDYGEERKPLRLLGQRAVHVSVFVTVEFPDEDLISMLQQYATLKTTDLRRLHYPEEGYRYIENGVRVAQLTKIERDIPKRLVVAGVEIGFKYSGQPSTCYRCQSTEHMVKNCPNRRRPPPPPPPTTDENSGLPADSPKVDVQAEQIADPNQSDWSSTAPDLFPDTEPQTASYAAAVTNESMDVSSARKRGAGAPSKSDDESVPAKHSAISASPMTADSAGDDSPTQPTPPEAPSPPPPGRGLTNFLTALAGPGKHRSTFMSHASGPSFYKCQGHYMYYKFGAYDKQKGRQLQPTAQEQWHKLTGTLPTDAFAALLDFHKVAQRDYKLFSDA